MIKRTIEISQQAAYLSVKDGQLLIKGKGEDAALIGQAPCEDVGVLLVDHPAVTYSHAALTELLEHDAAVVLCGRDHLPVGLLLPIGEHTQIVWRIKGQLSAGKPLRKQLWTQIVQAKIRAQAANLPEGSTTKSKLLALARNVRSGDPSNIEAQAARAYWGAWRQKFAGIVAEFQRDPDGAAPNNLLNYGYAVMRAAVARAIVSAGLMPTLGIKHGNRSNAFCLADDLVEPVRGMVDAAVEGLVQRRILEITPDAKRELLGLLASEVVCAGQGGPLMVALHRYAASLVRCFEGEAKELEIPVAVGSA
jgi:CRISPR-associated protein Cas1